MDHLLPVVLLLTTLVCFGSGQIHSNTISDFFQNRDISLGHHGLGQSDENFEKLKTLFLESILPPFIQEFVSLDPYDREDMLYRATENVSEVCIQHVIYSLNELVASIAAGQLPEDWLLQMVDSWGKFPSGILAGHTAEPGDFHECLQVRATNGSQQIYKGSYCSMYVFPAEMLDQLGGLRASGGIRDPDTGPISARKIEDIPGLIQGMFNAYGVLSNPLVGMCFPSSCSTADTTALVNNLLEIVGLGGIINCYTDEKEDFDGGDKAMIAILSIIGIFLILGTLLDVLYVQKLEFPQEVGWLIKIFVAFSLYTNIQKVVATTAPEGSLGCLHGLRFLSMSWVILGHTWLLMLHQFTWNLVDASTVWDNWTLSPVLNSSIAVDTFFVMSGCLVAYNLFHQLDKRKGKVNFPLMYLHRYLRLTPTYAIFIGILATLLPYVGKSPLWIALETESNNCQHNWWHNLIYINNLVSYNETAMCHGETWYLANDMQFFILSPLVIYPLWRWKVVGFALVALASFGTLLTNFLLTYYKELEPTLAPFTPVTDYLNIVYHKPWTRVGPYLIGIMLGYFLHITRGKQVKICPWIKSTCWGASTAVALAIVYGAQPWIDPTNHKEATTSGAALFYAGVHRFLWGVIVAWIVFACVKGHGGFVNSFLSWRAFVPLSRLTYCVYISSFQVQLIYHLSTMHPVHYSTYIMTNLFLAHMLCCLLVGFIATVTLESPFLQLAKYILPSKL